MTHKSIRAAWPQAVAQWRRAFGRLRASRWALVLVALVLTAGCKSSHKAASGSNGAQQRYERKAIKETTEARLRDEVRLIDAKMLAESGKPEQAIVIYQQLLKGDSTLSAANYELSRLMAMGGMVDSALVLARRAVRHADKNKWYLLHLATLQRYAGDAKGLAATMERVTKVEPEELSYYYELSNAYLMDGDYKHAVEALNRVERRVGVTEEVSMQKYKIWKQSGNDDRAMRELAVLAEMAPDNAHINGMLGEAYMAGGQYAKAKSCYDRVLAVKPDDEYIHISLAEYYKAVKEPEKAYDELLLGMRQPQLSTTNKLRILTNFFSADEFYGKRSQEALRLLEAAMEGSADSMAYATFYGDMLMRNARYAEAAHQFALALKADSSRYEVWEALLICELSSDADTSLLMTDAKRAERLFPLHQLPLYVQGAVHQGAGRCTEALRLLDRCEALGFEKGFLEPEVYLLKAECLSKTDAAACYDYYDRYLNLRPDDMGVLNNYAYRLAVNGEQLEKALRMSRRTIDADPKNHTFLDTYAWVLHQMGNDAEALKYMTKALENGGDSEEVKEHWRIISGQQ